MSEDFILIYKQIKLVSEKNKYSKKISGLVEVCQEKWHSGCAKPPLVEITIPVEY